MNLTPAVRRRLAEQASRRDRNAKDEALRAVEAFLTSSRYRSADEDELLEKVRAGLRGEFRGPA